MKDAETKRPVYLSDKELGYIEHILYHFTDYMGGDDRPDHGWGILKEYRNIDEADKYFITDRKTRSFKQFCRFLFDIFFAFIDHNRRNISARNFKSRVKDVFSFF